MQAQQLREQSILDPLTGLYNRLYLDETLKRELYRMARSQHQLGLIMLDADNFKEVNDSLGHGAGDMFLREWGAFLKGHIRKEDIAYRYGGDEFLLILPDVTREGVLARAENLRDAVKWLQVQRESRVFGPVTFSLGVAIYPEHGTTSDGLLRAVDAMLYRVKRDGRDSVRVVD